MSRGPSLHGLLAGHANHHPMLANIASLLVERSASASYGERQFLARIGIARIRNDRPAKTRLTPNPVNPSLEVPSLRKVKSSVSGKVAISKNGHIRDRVRVASNKRFLPKLLVQQVEGSAPSL